MNDHYATLGISRTADAVTIRAAYVRRMKEVHPDRNSTSETLRRAQDVTAAYAVLGDPSRRANYDSEREALHRWEQIGQGPPVRRTAAGTRALVVAAAFVGLAGLAWAITVIDPARRATTASIGIAPKVLSCADLADGERIRGALIERLESIGAASPSVQAALAAATFKLDSVSDEHDLAERQRRACRATLTVTLPPGFQTAGGQAVILSDLLFSLDRGDMPGEVGVQPDARLVAALGTISSRSEPGPPPALGSREDEPLPMIEEIDLGARQSPISSPRRFAVEAPKAERAKESRILRKPAVVESTRVAPVAAPPVAQSPIGKLGEQTAGFFNQSWTYADEARRARLQATQPAFVSRLSRCQTDDCRRDAYLARNVEISRIMMRE